MSQKRVKRDGEKNDENKEKFVCTMWRWMKTKRNEKIGYKNNEQNAKSNEFQLIEYTGLAIFLIFSHT